MVRSLAQGHRWSIDTNLDLSCSKIHAFNYCMYIPLPLVVWGRAHLKRQKSPQDYRFDCNLPEKTNISKCNNKVLWKQNDEAGKQEE